MRLKSFHWNKYLFLILLFLVCFAIFVVCYFSYSVDSYISTNIKNYAEALIVRSIESEIIDKIDDSDFLVESYDENGFVSYAYVNTKKINQVRNDVSDYINAVMDDISNSNEITSISIPLGYFFGMKYITGSEIRIPLSLEVLGDQDVDIKKNTISTGINTTILEFYLDILISIKIVMPLKTKEMEINVNIPISMEILNNEIPYYLSDFS